MAQKNVNERDAIFAEEAFVVDVQILLHEIMEEKGVTRADLARAMNVSRARVTQLFSDECKNFTIRLLAKAMHALGEKPRLQCAYLDQVQKSAESAQRWNFECELPVAHFWVEMKEEQSSWTPANDNRLNRLAHLAARHRPHEIREAA